MLAWNGPGVSNGYGFGEWVTEQYFRDKGFYTITNEFNLLSRTSKFKRYNDIISLMTGQEKLNQFKDAVKILVETDYSIENPDMFIFNLETCFFEEVKKAKDVLRVPQMRFMYLAQSILGIHSILIYLSDYEDTEFQQSIEIEFDIPKVLENTMNNC
ncbi:hypothetical protein [Neobacillus sp. PS2-9]|uniref:hypothetical protein n=1 Tax=Neobacillus sp. PS2-9 TaxID=3070676 RepID=UPI0027E18900|nr:hypothetical protein [Neobacillus sp. PS2-9]WML58647.1 hypothetical protein RCG25_02305 [Neobacillus sp. PS2-9]